MQMVSRLLRVMKVATTETQRVQRSEWRQVSIENETGETERRVERSEYGEGRRKATSHSSFLSPLSYRSFSLSDERGITLVEELVAVAILGVLGVALIGALSTGSLGARTVSLEVTARNIAVAQMEYTDHQANQAPPVTYSSIAVPDNWSVSSAAATVVGRDSNVQKISVTVYHQGNSYLTLEGFKVNR